MLDDKLLHEYRHPGERRMLVVAVVTVTILAIGGFIYREMDVMLGAAAVYASMLAVSLQAKTSYRLQGAEVTPTQFPEIYKLVEDLRRRFDAPPTRVFVIRKQLFKTEAAGLVAPFVIVLPSVVIDALDLDELRYVLGQALGNICFGHTRVAVLLGGEESALPAVLSWVAWVRDLIFSGYWRTATMSADRAGVLACGNLDTALRALIKLSIGPNLFGDVRTEDLLAQGQRLRQGMSRVQAFFIRWRSPVPPLIMRLEAMVEWAGQPNNVSLGVAEGIRGFQIEVPKLKE